MTDQGAEGLFSSWLRRRRLKIVRQYIKGRVLDYGCGIGMLSSFCKADLYFGVDINHRTVEAARRRYPLFRFEVEVQPTESFDTIVALAIIEHVHDKESLLRFFASMLKEGGRLVLTTPHPSFGWIHTLGARFGLFSAHASEEHEDLIDLKRLQTLIAHAGLEIVKYRRFLFMANQLIVASRPGERGKRR